MKSYYIFFKNHWGGVSFGWLLTFFSSFGQTFLISLYVPDILREFSLSNGLFGGYYAIGTVAASFFMLATGHYMDYKPVKQVSMLTVAGLAVSCLLLGASPHPFLLLFALTGLRLAGQGMMSHISLTVMSRHYGKDRGKALSLASLGHSVGEAVLPALIAFLVLQGGWRFASLSSGVFLLLLLLPLKKAALGVFDLPSDEIPERKGLRNTFGPILKSKGFWFVAPSAFAFSFSVTALFFYQFVVVEAKGWPLGAYSLFFTAYAVTRLVVSLLGGLGVDRFGAVRLFRLYLLPMAVAVAVMSQAVHVAEAGLFLVLTGVTAGLSSPVVTALIAELYGTATMGTVRSLFSIVTVVGSALGPVCFGVLLDAGWPFNSVFLLFAGLMALAALNNLRASRKPAKP